ncbi:MAG: HAD hydrolase-like protein [Deltaproteobacteria bacterium]|nr:HAD hydrolase-like protein [Deltaproteobacteria bacterium]
MTNRPFHIKAILFRLEPTTALLKISQDLVSKDLRLGIISRSDSKSVLLALRKSRFVNQDDMDVIISQPEIMRHKADTDLIHRAAQKMNVAVASILFISSHPSEIRTVHKMGAITAWMRAGQNEDPEASTGDFEIEDIAEIKNIVRMGIPLPAGKLPNPLLREFLNQFVFEDSSVLINPGVGEDIAAVDIESQEVLVLKSDPITFATDSIGQYAVLINANDIATSGAIPRWFLTTLFFPCGTTPSQIKSVFDELKHFCQQWDITLCGGHTEITEAVVRPIVAGMMAGTVPRSNLIDKRQMKTGDQVLLSKGVAVEGTAIIAREFGSRLKKLGISSSEIGRCHHFLDQISVMTEAKIAAESPATTAMHDVTEGGLATALAELSIAGGHKIKVSMNQIPVYPETQKICDLLDIDPLGLIGSGSLLICCHSSEYPKLMQRIEAAGIEIACIGEVLGSGQGIQAYKGKKQVPWPHFEVDEITKLF